jgi:hypothetical protein
MSQPWYDDPEEGLILCWRDGVGAEMSESDIVARLNHLESRLQEERKALRSIAKLPHCDAHTAPQIARDSLMGGESGDE